jgi:hypothetical protein
MGLFDFLNKPGRPLDFSDDKVKRLETVTDNLGETLIKAGQGFYVDHLSQIRLAAKRCNGEGFKKLVISPELFGGAGALCEIIIKDKQLGKKFEKEFREFVDLLKDIGIRNGRVNQISKYLRRRD